MDRSFEIKDEKIIKNKIRVQNHGEVFTPKRIVKQLLNLPNIREACGNLTSTFLEPAVGEGAFLVEILTRKMQMVTNIYNRDLICYENYSLLALSTLYGVELLEDNTRKCVMNMYQVYYEFYQKQVLAYGMNMNDKVLASAKLIISNNIVQGNFLTQLSANGKPIIFSEWEPVKLRKSTKIIKVQRTEYAIQDILNGSKNESGELLTHRVKLEQLDLFDLVLQEEYSEKDIKQMKYVPVKIVDVYKEETEEVYE